LKVISYSAILCNCLTFWKKEGKKVQRLIYIIDLN
jgi:hypothetical protein